MKKEISELNEQIVCECKTHYIALLIPAIIGILFFLLSIISVIMIPIYAIYPFITFLLCFIIVLGFSFLKIKTSCLILSDKRIYGRAGIIKVQSLSAPISKIQTVYIKKGILGRILGYGDIKIHCVTGIYIFKKQINAEEMQNAILNILSN